MQSYGPTVMRPRPRMAVALGASLQTGIPSHLLAVPAMEYCVHS